MSSTNVKLKASSARSEARPSKAKGPGNEHSADQRSGNAVMKGASALDAKEKARGKNASPTAGATAKDGSPTFDGITEKARSYLNGHEHAVVYGIIGIVAAVLILTIGFWPVLLLAVFAAIGIAIGKFRDSGSNMQTAARSLVNSIRR